MTPEQISSIISAMPEGKRKRACQAMREIDFFDLDREPAKHEAAIWLYVACKDYHLAGSAVLDTLSDSHPATAAILADMIWEGGA